MTDSRRSVIVRALLKLLQVAEEDSVEWHRVIDSYDDKTLLSVHTMSDASLRKKCAMVLINYPDDERYRNTFILLAGDDYYDEVIRGSQFYFAINTAVNSLGNYPQLPPYEDSESYYEKVIALTGVTAALANSPFVEEPEDNNFKDALITHRVGTITDEDEPTKSYRVKQCFLKDDQLVQFILDHHGHWQRIGETIVGRRTGDVRLLRSILFDVPAVSEGNL